MKNKLLIISMIMLFIITGCVNGKEPNNNNNNEEQELTKKIKGITISIGDINLINQYGDLDEKGNEADNGGYFMLGSKLELSSDYKRVEVPISFNNENDYSYYFGVGGWKAYLSDVNSENEFLLVMVTEEVAGEVKPNTQGTGTLYIIIKEEQLKKNDLILVYNYLNYNDEWQTALQKRINNEMTHEAYKELYTPTSLEFKLKIN
ncbi:MAG: hypothetical protein PHS45_03465 [Bacilli bacterium]|nr:hypothetical protein [Bacilli bacterium]